MHAGRNRSLFAFLIPIANRHPSKLVAKSRTPNVSISSFDTANSKVWPDGCRELTKTARGKSQVLQSIDIACVILYLCVELSDAALGSSHPRCELILFNQTFRETVDQPLQRVLQFEALRLQGLDSFQRSANPAALIFMLTSRGALEITHFVPDGRFQKLTLDLRIAANALATKPITIRSTASVVAKVVLVPALVDVALFRATQEQLQENRSRARLGRRRPGYLLQGLTCCARCGYAYYGKTTHRMGAGHQMKGFSA